MGAEHYEEAIPALTCLEHRSRGSGGAIRGAVDVTTPTEVGTSERLLPVVYAAWVIGRDLER